MSWTLRADQRTRAYPLAGLLVLGLVASACAEHKPLTKEEQDKVDKAIDKGIAYLKRTQTRQGDWPRYRSGYLVGQCALPAYALLEAGVPADDPVIQKAAAFLRPRVAKNDRTYEISLAILFFDRLGDPKDKKLIESLALRLIASQHYSGGWSYRCLTATTENEAALLKSLYELSKRLEDHQAAKEALKGMEIPRPLRPLTVFQPPERFEAAWNPERLTRIREALPNDNRGANDHPFSLVGGTDNSNTQFALLALWAARRHGVPMERTLALLVERFERTQADDGWWPYVGEASRVTHSLPSMICVGLLGLAVGSGLKLPTSRAAAPDQESLRVLRGLAALYQEVGTPTGQMRLPLPLDDLYYLWSVERVGMLYDLPTLGDKDWYRWGAEILITNQLANGAWLLTSASTRHWKLDYGPVLSTSFSLLFLKRSHPMKELTPKLPYTAKELNQGIARLVTGAAPPEPASNAPSRREKPQR